MNNVDVSQVEQRVRRYWYSDGLGELSGGGMFILLALYFAGQQVLASGSTLRFVLEAGLVIFLVGGMLLSRWLVKVLKARLTYPRTGYVEYRVDKQHVVGRRIASVIVAALVAMFSLVFAGWIGSLDVLVAITGLIVGLVLIFLQARSTGVMRFYVLGAVSLALGVALSTLGLPQGYGLGLYYGLMGLAFMISGGWVLNRYLRANPLPGEAAHG